MHKLPLFLSAAALALAGCSSAIAQHESDKHGPDANGDGSITLAEMQAHGAAMFAKMDTNGDGTINAADHEERKADRFADMDTDKNGELSQAEMKAAHEARMARREEKREQRAEARADRMAEHFAKMDTDKSGGISEAEMKAAHEARAEHGGHGGKRDGHGATMGGSHGGGHGAGMRGGHMIGMADANKDKSVTRAEFDAGIDAHFKQADTDGDGSISEAEHKAAREAMHAAHKAQAPKPAGN